MQRFLTHVAAAACVFAAGTANAMSTAVDLSAWTAESYPAVSGFSPGEWEVASDNKSVTQTTNGQPTLFYSDFNAHGTAVTGQIEVSGTDDDFIGFLLGYQPDDINNTAADYLMIDWKARDQSFNFGAPSSKPGSTAEEGLAASRVSGIPTADEFWGHTDFTENSDGGVEELARGMTLGSTGWMRNTVYEFVFDFGPGNLQVYVDDMLEFDLSGDFENGRLAFYNFSQAGVTYSGFESEEGSFTPVPAPTTAVLLIAGLLGLLAGRRLTD